MRILTLLSITILTITLINCKRENTADSENSSKIEESAGITRTDKEIILKLTLESKNDSKATGDITFTEKDGMVTMAATITGLSEGIYAINIYEKADTPVSDKKSMNSQWNPSIEPRVLWKTKEGYDRGDIGNFKADADGKGSITFATNEWCIGCDDAEENILSKAIIINQGKDHYTSQTRSASQASICCGAIIR